MPDEIQQKFREYLNDLASLKDFLESLKTDIVIGTLANRPGFSVMQTGADFLITNLEMYQKKRLNEM